MSGSEKDGDRWYRVVFFQWSTSRFARRFGLWMGRFGCWLTLYPLNPRLRWTAWIDVAGQVKKVSHSGEVGM